MDLDPYFAPTVLEAFLCIGYLISDVTVVVVAVDLVVGLMFIAAIGLGLSSAVFMVAFNLESVGDPTGICTP